MRRDAMSLVLSLTFGVGLAGCAEDYSHDQFEIDVIARGEGDTARVEVTVRANHITPLGHGDNDADPLDETMTAASSDPATTLSVEEPGVYVGAVPDADVVHVRIRERELAMSIPSLSASLTTPAAGATVGIAFSPAATVDAPIRYVVLGPDDVSRCFTDSPVTNGEVLQVLPACFIAAGCHQLRVVRRELTLFEGVDDWFYFGSRTREVVFRVDPARPDLTCAAAEVDAP